MAASLSPERARDGAVRCTGFGHPSRLSRERGLSNLIPVPVFRSPADCRPGCPPWWALAAPGPPEAAGLVGPVHRVRRLPAHPRVGRGPLRANDGRCELCGQAKHDGVRLEVDHIRPRATRPDLALDAANLQVLCGPIGLLTKPLDRPQTRGDPSYVGPVEFERMAKTGQVGRPQTGSGPLARAFEPACHAPPDKRPGPLDRRRSPVRRHPSGDHVRDPGRGRPDQRLWPGHPPEPPAWARRLRKRSPERLP